MEKFNTRNTEVKQPGYNLLREVLTTYQRDLTKTLLLTTTAKEAEILNSELSEVRKLLRSAECQ